MFLMRTSNATDSKDLGKLTLHPANSSRVGVEEVGDGF